MVKNIMEVTGCGQDTAIVTLHDCNDESEAIQRLLDSSSSTTQVCILEYHSLLTKVANCILYKCDKIMYCHNIRPYFLISLGRVGH